MNNVSYLWDGRAILAETQLLPGCTTRSVIRAEQVPGRRKVNSLEIQKIIVDQIKQWQLYRMAESLSEPCFAEFKSNCAIFHANKTIKHTTLLLQTVLEQEQ